MFLTLPTRAITGHATIVPLLAYALFGPSRILVLGPDSSLAAVILGVVLPLSGGDPVRAIALAGMMAVVSGTVCILAGAARLGFVTELLSKPIRYGYMNGIALTVLISQLPKVFGFSIEGDGPLRKLWAIAEAVLDGKVNWTAFAVGAGTLAVILLLKNSKRVPGISPASPLAPSPSPSRSMGGPVLAEPRSPCKNRARTPWTKTGWLRSAFRAPTSSTSLTPIFFRSALPGRRHLDRIRALDGRGSDV